MYNCIAELFGTVIHLMELMPFHNTHNAPALHIGRKHLISGHNIFFWVISSARFEPELGADFEPRAFSIKIQRKFTQNYRGFGCRLYKVQEVTTTRIRAETTAT
jgi:hypothetical protein